MTGQEAYELLTSIKSILDTEISSVFDLENNPVPTAPTTLDLSNVLNSLEDINILLNLISENMPNCEDGIDGINGTDGKDGKDFAPVLLTADPVVSYNPTDIGSIVINKTTGQIFVCTDITTDKNVWVGQFTSKKIEFINGFTFDLFSDSSAILHYTFNNDILDNGGHYPLTGSVSFVPSIVGLGSCGSFLNQRLNSDFLAPPVFTVSLFVKFNSVGTTGIIGFGNGSFGYELVIHNSKCGVTSGKGQSPFFTPVINTVYHIVFDSNLNMWLDVVKLTNAQSFSYSAPSSASKLGIGSSVSYNSYYLSGFIDQIRFFNRALTQIEINTLFAEKV